jgi:hypothetical protein
MKLYKITWQGSVYIRAENEEDARDKFCHVELDADDEYQNVCVTEADEAALWFLTLSLGRGPGRELEPNKLQKSKITCTHSKNIMLRSAMT